MSTSSDNTSCPGVDSNRKAMMPGSENTTEEEAPGMRSVALTALGTSTMFEAGEVISSHPQLSKPSMGSSKLAPLSKESYFGVKKEWTASAPADIWSVRGTELELVPVDFPLERTHREINEDATKVAQRVSETLRALSVETTYCSHVKGKAKCCTEDHVAFRIRLFAGNESGQPVIVEVQRRSGSASSFMRTCRAILASAEGRKLERRKLPFGNKPIGQMECLQEVSLPPPKSATSLDHALRMLRSKQHDVNILGLENLQSLTDPIKTSPKVALETSKELLLACGLREEVSLLTERDSFPQSDDGMMAHQEKLRHLALAVLANAVRMCSNDDCLSEAIDNQDWFISSLLPILLDEVKRVRDSTGCAYQAACCIHGLIASSSRARNHVVKNGGREIMEEAHKFGSRSHQLLETECVACKSIMG